MLKTMTRNQLYQIDQEIKSMQSQSPALALLLSNRIKLFYEKARVQLEVMWTRFKEIQEKYVQKDPQGNFLTTGEGENAKWKFIESKADLVNARVLDVSLVEQSFNEECKKMFSQTIQFDW